MISILKDVLSHWLLPTIQTIEPIQENTVFKVFTSDQTFALKDVSDQWPSERYEFISDILKHVENGGVTVSTLLRNKIGKVVTDFEGKRFVLSRFIEPGCNPKWPDQREDLFRHIGGAVAQLHCAFDFWDAEWVAQHTYREDFLGCLDRKHMVQNGLSEEHVYTLVEVDKMRRADKNRALEGLPEQLIHRDCYIDNIIVDGVDVLGVIDFDNACVASPFQDIAYFLADTSWILTLDFDQWLDLVPILLSGYVNKRPISIKEIGALPYMILYWHISFARWHASLGEDDVVAAHMRAVKWIHNNFERVQNQVGSVEI